MKRIATLMLVVVANVFLVARFLLPFATLALTAPEVRWGPFTLGTVDLAAKLHRGVLEVTRLAGVFGETLGREWHRSLRSGRPLAALLTSALLVSLIYLLFTLAFSVYLP